MTPPTPPDHPGAAALVHAVTDDAVAAVRGLTDPVEREHAAADAIWAANHLRGELARARRDAVRDLRARPLSWDEVGALLGVTGSRARQVADYGPGEDTADRRRRPRGRGVPDVTPTVDPVDAAGEDLVARPDERPPFAAELEATRPPHLEDDQP